MSATLGYILLFILCLAYSVFFVYQMRQIVKGRVQELDQVIKTLSREKNIEEKLSLIKSYEVTIERRLIEIEKAVGLDNSNFND